MHSNCKFVDAFPWKQFFKSRTHKIFWLLVKRTGNHGTHLLASDKGTGWRPPSTMKAGEWSQKEKVRNRLYTCFCCLCSNENCSVNGWFIFVYCRIPEGRKKKKSMHSNCKFVDAFPWKQFFKSRTHKIIWLLAQRTDNHRTRLLASDNKADDHQPGKHANDPKRKG